MLVIVVNVKIWIRSLAESQASMNLDVSDSDVSRAAARIADWLAETGGLWAKRET